MLGAQKQGYSWRCGSVAGDELAHEQSAAPKKTIEQPGCWQEPCLLRGHVTSQVAPAPHTRPRLSQLRCLLGTATAACSTANLPAHCQRPHTTCQCSHTRKPAPPPACRPPRPPTAGRPDAGGAAGLRRTSGAAVPLPADLPGAAPPAGAPSHPAPAVRRQGRGLAGGWVGGLRRGCCVRWGRRAGTTCSLPIVLRLRTSCTSRAVPPTALCTLAHACAQGDGTAQLLCRDAAAQGEVCRILAADFPPMSCMPFTVPPTAGSTLPASSNGAATGTSARANGGSRGGSDARVLLEQGASLAAADAKQKELLLGRAGAERQPAHA